MIYMGVVARIINYIGTCSVPVLCDKQIFIHDVVTTDVAAITNDGNNEVTVRTAVGSTRSF